MKVGGAWFRSFSNQEGSMWDSQRHSAGLKVGSRPKRTESVGLALLSKAGMMHHNGVQGLYCHRSPEEYAAIPRKAASEGNFSH